MTPKLQHSPSPKQRCFGHYFFIFKKERWKSKKKEKRKKKKEEDENWRWMGWSGHPRKAKKKVVFAKLQHNFDWTLPGGARGEDLDMTESIGLTIHKKFPLIAVATPYC
jgi:hypothetical protein